MTTTSQPNLMTCGPMRTDAFTLTEPYVLANDQDDYSVLIPGDQDPLALVSIAVDTMAAYGLDVNTNDPDLIAEVTTRNRVRFHRCSNQDHAFHPEFGAPSAGRGTLVVATVTFTHATS